jgi:Na+/melibiose symporter-like transporter
VIHQAKNGWHALADAWRSGDRNTLIFATESALAAAAGVASAFNGAYILRLGASNALIGLMSSLPSLATMLLYIPVGLFLRKRRIVPWVVGGQAAFRAIYLLIALAPLVTGRAVTQVTAILMMLAALPPIISSVSLGPLMSDVIPPHQRASLITWRTTLRNGTAALLVYLAGVWLDRHKGAFPANHQWLYLASVAMGVAHTCLLALIRPPAKPVGQLGSEASLVAAPAPPRAKAVDLAILRENPSFGRLLVNKLVYDAGDMLVGPLMSIYIVRQLQASNTWLGASSTLTSICIVAGLWAWRRAVRRLGENRALWYSLPFAAPVTLLVALVPNLWWILAFQLLATLGGAGANLALEVLYLDSLPAGHKSAATGLYNTAVGIAAVVLPMAGVALSYQIGVVPAMLLGGSLRLAGAAIFYLRPVKPREHPPLGAAATADAAGKTP